VERLYQSLRALIDSGMTIVLVEQDLSRAMGVADRVICMLEGHVVLTRDRQSVSREEITQAYFGLRRAGEGLRP